VALASGEHFPVPDHLQYFGREERLRVVGDANNVEFQCFDFFVVLQISSGFQLRCVVEGEDSIA